MKRQYSLPIYYTEVPLLIHLLIPIFIIPLNFIRNIKKKTKYIIIYQ